MAEPDLFAPSDYTAHLMLAARAHARASQPARILEIGVGSGAVLAEVLRVCAGRAWGVDLEPLAVAASERLLATLGLSERCTIEHGQLWSTSQGRQFDLILANLPHFASDAADDSLHLPSWSIGGADGRNFVDPFLLGLARHLAPKGCALMTHNVFIDFARTCELLGPLGLSAQVILSGSTVLAPHKLARMTPAVRERSEGRCVHVVGPYAFVDFDIVRIARQHAGGGDAA